MKKIILLLALFSSFAFSIVNESKVDVYFGNGILTKEGDAEDNAKLLEESIKQKYGLTYYKKHIGKVDYAYNSTWDRAHDLLEAYIQLDREDPKFFDNLKTIFMRFFTEDVVDKINDEIAPAKVDEVLVRAVEAKDLSRQIDKYKNSIKIGHRVLIVAHSQGTLFANRVYELIGQDSKYAWMQKYILPVYVAPASSYEFLRRNHMPSFTFRNDPISLLAKHFGFPTTENPNKYKKIIEKNEWFERSYSIEKNLAFHRFSYYMGKPILISDYDGTREVNTTVGRDAILTFVKTQLNKLEMLPSQWSVKTANCSCKNGYALAFHKYDKSLSYLMGNHMIENRGLTLKIGV